MNAILARMRDRCRSRILARTRRYEYGNGLFPVHLYLKNLSLSIPNLNLSERDSSLTKIREYPIDTASGNRRYRDLVMPSDRLRRGRFFIRESDRCRCITRIEHEPIEIARTGWKQQGQHRRVCQYYERSLCLAHLQAPVPAWYAGCS